MGNGVTVNDINDIGGGVNSLIDIISGGIVYGLRHHNRFVSGYSHAE
jgi:hypothetical protein